jgi:hypothetical protein
MWSTPLPSLPPKAKSPPRVKKPQRHTKPQRRTKLPRHRTSHRSAPPLRQIHIRAYLANEYARGGINAVLRLLSEPMIADIRSTCYAFIKDPEKILMAIAGLFVFIVILDAMRPRTVATTIGALTPGSMSNPIPW